MNDVEIVTKNLEVLGIEAEATRVYLELYAQGHTSALQLAKTTGISRTQVYRHLELLQQHGLVSAEQLSYGTLYRALPIENVEALLADQEAKTASVRGDLASMAQALQVLAGSSGPKATVKHYYGLAGLKQVNWNLTKAEKEFKVFEAAHLSQHLDKAFARRCRERFMERGLTSYDLTNDTSARASDLEPFDPARSFIRRIDPEILTIGFEAYMYDHTVTLVDYSGDNRMAMEIHHPALHRMMVQLFDAMWTIATPLEIR